MWPGLALGDDCQWAREIHYDSKTKAEHSGGLATGNDCKRSNEIDYQTVTKAALRVAGLALGDDCQ